MNTTANKFCNTETYNANDPVKVDIVTIEHLHDSDPDTSYLEQGEFKDELARFQDGEFCFIGIRAKATVSRPIGWGSRRLQEFTSSGLWGIASDSGQDYFDSIAKGELQNLSEHLREFGIEMTAEQLEAML